MVHTMPDLKVTQKLAQKLGHDDTRRLLADRKLVLLVDLDQTVIHTTNDTVPDNIKGIYHFQLYGPHSPWYHTRLRPGTAEFLERMSQLYELHICTFGARNYAHMIAQLLDPEGKFFSHRILSRDECFNATSKTDNLKWVPINSSIILYQTNNWLITELSFRMAIEWQAIFHIHTNCKHNKARRFKQINCI